MTNPIIKESVIIPKKLVGKKGFGRIQKIFEV